ncbi:MAG: hypothetical protein AAF993_15265 [Pseudomonadota bacterium]
MSGMSDPTTGHKLFRLVLGLVGGFAFTAGYIATGGVLFNAAGLSAGDAVTLAVFTGLLLFVALLIWCAATTHLLRTFGIVTLGSMVMLFGAPVLVTV